MKSNAIRLYRHYCEMAENPKGSDSLERALVRRTALVAKADLLKKFKTLDVYKNDPEIAELLGKKESKSKKSN